MRQQHEVVRKIDEITKEGSDIFGAMIGDLLVFLDFDHARPFLKDGVTASEWGDTLVVLTDENVKAAIAEYMPFAWSKVEDHRGLSASRNIDHMRAWLWLLGAEQIVAAMEAAPYAMYGAPQLAVVCRAYNLPVPEDTKVRRMIDGLPCSDDCTEGCAL